MENSEKTSEYSKIKKTLKEDGYNWEKKPSQKAYNLLVYIRRPTLSEKITSRFAGRFSPKRKTYQYIPPFKEKVENYSKENIEEALIHKLSKLSSEGVFRIKNTTSKIKPIIYQFEYENSLRLVRDIDDILSQKRLLTKKGFSEGDILKYNGFFKKRINRINKITKEFPEFSEKNKFAKNLLKYTKEDLTLEDILGD